MRVPLAVAAAVLALAIHAADVHAALTAVGPIDPGTGAPAYFEDASGLQLELCHPGTRNCGPIAPGEDFYYQAISSFTAPNGGLATLILNLTLAPNASGNPAVFNRVRIQLDNFPEGTYSITHPYGTDSVVVPPGRRGRTTVDVGCADVTVGACDWATVLAGRFGPFLVPAPGAPAPPAGFIGDSLTQVPVTGSPTGDNLFRVEGPGLPAGGVQSTTFALTGKLFEGPVPEFSSSGSLAFGSQLVGASPVTRAITVASSGLRGSGSDLKIAGVTLGGPAASDYAISDTCAGSTLSSGSTCTVGVTFTPSAPGVRNATLTFTDNTDAGTHTVALSGTGTMAPPPAAAPAAAATAPAPARALAPAPTLATAPSVLPAADPGSIAALSVKRRAHLHLVHRALAVRFTTAPGALFARVRLLTLSHRRQVADKVVSLAAPGRQTVHLRARHAHRGRYLVEVRVGRDSASYGDPAFARVKVVR